MAKNNRYLSGEELLKRAIAPKEEVEEDEEDYEMPRKEAVAEHQRLISVLRSGDKKAQLAEAQRQEKELKKIIK